MSTTCQGQYTLFDTVLDATEPAPGTWVETQDRYPFWRAHPNVSLITLRDRPKFVGNGTDFAAYGWFIWSTRQQFVMPCVAAQAGEGDQHRTVSHRQNQEQDRA